MAKKKSKQVPQNDEHTIPGPVRPEALNISTIKKKKYQELAITEYVEWQMPDEEVQFLEKITTEQLYETRSCLECPHRQKAILGYNKSNKSIFTRAVPQPGLHIVISYWGHDANDGGSTGPS